MCSVLVAALFIVTSALRQERDEAGDERSTRAVIAHERVPCSRQLVHGELGYDWIDAHDCDKSGGCQWRKTSRFCFPRCTAEENQNGQRCETPCLWSGGRCQESSNSGDSQNVMVDARTENGWTILGVANTGDSLLAEEDPKTTGACNSLKAVLEDGGAVIVRVEAQGVDERGSQPQKALFRALVSHTSPKSSFRDWSEPLEDALYGEVQGASDAYDAAAQERMEAQVDRAAIVLNRLRTQLPPDFGTVWVLMLVEHERDSASFASPQQLSVACFRYVGEDTGASGAGGFTANIATAHLFKALPHFVEKCWDDRFSTSADPNAIVRGTDMPRDLLNQLYVRAFAMSSQALAKPKLQTAENGLSSIATFVRDCKESVKSGKLVGTCEVNRANQFIREHFTGSGSDGLSGDELHVLKKFLNAHGGVAYFMEKRQEISKLREELGAQSSAREAFLHRQAGPDKIPDEGVFTLSDANASKTMSLLFDDALSKGNWVCVRTPDVSQECHYQIVGSSSTPLASQFHKWQMSVIGDEVATPLTRGTITMVPEEQLRWSIEEFQRSRREQFSDAQAALQHLDQAQTLCVHRFQFPFRRDEDAASVDPLLFEFQTSWQGKSRELKIIFAPTVLAVRKWFRKWQLTATDDLFDSFPTKLASYDDVVKKYRWWTFSGS